MNCTDLFKKDFKEASTIICAMSEKEVSALDEAVSHMSVSFQSRYARLLVFRKDSLRLLSLLNDGEPELCRNCVRYLKIHAIRKDLLSKLTDEASFIDLFNKSCELGKSILLECLVWNKDRPANCLADRLSKNPSLVLNAKQSALLKSACSIEKCVEDVDVAGKKFFRLRGREIEKAALYKLYALYCDYKKGGEKSKQENNEAKEKCDQLIRYVHRITTTITVGEERLTAMDLILDLFCLLNTKDRIAKSYLDGVSSSSRKTVDALSPRLTSDKKRLTRENYSSLSDAFNAVVFMAPIYTMKKIDFVNCRKELGHYYNDFTCTTLLSLIQNATLLEETEALDYFLQELANPCHLSECHDLVQDGDLDNIEKVLTKEQFAAFLDKLAENLAVSFRHFSKSDMVYYTEIPSVVTYLSHHLPGDDERLLALLDQFFCFEKQYVSRSATDAINFYGLQIKEVPLDFSYQMGTRDLLGGCKTVRKFESVLCLKGNTFLNTREADERMKALKALVAIAGRSHDVRALSRCLTVYTRTEMKFSDISMDLTPFTECFSPDALGLSPLSLRMSGSPEEAAKGREAVVKSLCEWGQSKKGDGMVGPLMYVVCSMYLYATLYHEYEEVYSAMMKPLVELLANSNMEWSGSTIGFSFNAVERRTQHAVQTQMPAIRAHCLQHCKELQNALLLERFCSKKLRTLNRSLTVVPTSVILPQLEFPNSIFSMPALAKAPLVMIMKLVNEEAVSSSLVCTILAKLLRCTCNTRVYKTTKEVIFPEKVDGCSVKRVTTTTTPSSDMAVVKELMDDTSFSIKGQFEGVSPFNSLHLLSTEIRSFMTNLHLTTFSNVSYSVVPPAQEKKKEVDLFTRLLSDKNAMMAYVKAHGGNSIDAEMSAALDDKMKDYTQKLMTVVHVDMSANGLRCLLDNATSLSLSFSIGSCSRVNLEKVLPLISDETLVKLHKLAALYVYILLQSAVLVVSLNKSDKPILDARIISTLSTIQFLFFDMLQTLMLINSACSYRGISKDNTDTSKDTTIPEEACLFSVKALAPFVVAWLNAVKDKATQSVEDMKKEDAFTLDQVREESVALDFADNEVVGRFVEIIFYSRYVKEYFGSSLGGAVRLISRMDIKTALTICRRFLLISSFVPLAESVFNNLLRGALSSSITSDIVSMLSDSSSGITVALIGLLFRLAANPLMKNQHEVMLQLITKVTNYVIDHDFKSEDVYVILLRWAFSKVLHPADVSLDYVKQLLSRLTAMSVDDDAGKIVFNVLLLCALHDTPCCERLKRSISSASGATSRFAEELDTMCGKADEENVKRLRDVARSLVPLFSITDETQFCSQCAALCAFQHTENCEAISAACEKVVRKMWGSYEDTGRMVSVAALFLFLQKGAEGMKAFEAGLDVYNKMLLMKLQSDTISKLLEFAALGLSDEEADLLDHNSLDNNLVGSFISCDILSDQQRIAFLASIEHPSEDWLPFKVFSQALLKALEGSEPFVQLEDAKMDMRVLAEEVEKTMEPWMMQALSDERYRLCRFSEDALRQLCAMVEEKITDTVCCLVLLSQFHTNITDEEAKKCSIYIKQNQKRELYFLLK